MYRYPPLTIWYDGGCPLCIREIGWMKRRDTYDRLTLVDVSDGTSHCPIDRADLLARFHVEEDGELLSGAAAFAAMWRSLPLLRPLGLAAKNPLILGLLERLYIVFLRFRPKLQRLARRLERD